MTIKGKQVLGNGHGLVRWAPLFLLVPAASCVPVGLAAAPEAGLTQTELAAYRAAPPGPAPAMAPLEITNNVTPGLAFLSGTQANLANAELPLSATPNPAAGAYVFTARTPVDQLRSADCLAQAIYFEARSESEDGQRAVAQVVLNRVRHPLWPKSVCGVVYQGSTRPGGGCQFTFTCDGSLNRQPGGTAWAQAQRLAAEALAGRTFAAIGLSTFYHANYVFPAWAPRLVKTAQIGAHIFYRLPGAGGTPDAFEGAYAGVEPLPHPVQTIFYNRTPNGLGAPGEVPLATLAASTDTPSIARVATVRPHSDIADQPRWAAANLPASDIRDEHAQSGQWRTDAPAAITGR